MFLPGLNKVYDDDDDDDDVKTVKMYSILDLK